MTPGSTSTRLYEAFVLDQQRFGLNRDQLVEALKSDNITARKFLDPPVHRMTCYRAMVGEVSLPNTDRVAANAVALPFPSDMSLDEVRAVSGAVASLHDRADAVRRRLRRSA